MFLTTWSFHDAVTGRVFLSWFVLSMWVEKLHFRARIMCLSVGWKMFLCARSWINTLIWF